VDETLDERVTPDEREVIRAHYLTAGPLLSQHFDGSPIIGVTFPYGLGRSPAYYKLAPSVPADVQVVEVATATGMHRFAGLDARSLAWLVGEQSVVEIHGWGPTIEDPKRAAFGRITLGPNGAAGSREVAQAALAVLDLLEERGLKAMPLLDGLRGIALWIPFDDGPDYALLAAWLGAFADRAAATHPRLLTTDWYKADRGDRVFLGTHSNHPDMGTILPYSLRGSPGLEVAVPIAREEIGKRANGDVTALNFAEYLGSNGDVFERLSGGIGAQRFAGLAAVPMVAGSTVYEIPFERAPEDLKSATVAAALEILRDGKTRDVSVILSEAIARGLLPTSIAEKTLYLALHGYIVRALGVGRTPEIAQIPKTTEFRINRPADDWPDVKLPARASWILPADREAVVQRLRATATGKDSEAFEVAACDAFALLSFVVTRLGGQGQTDGVLIAPLGVAGYRVILECKTASPSGTVSNPRPEEAAKFRGEHQAEYSILLGPAFGHEASLDDELVQHGVSLWTVDDLVTALEEEVGAYEIRPLLAPGRVARGLEALLWERDHGRAKRVAVIAELILRLGWRLQVSLARGGVLAADSPALTEEALAVLVDDELIRDGVIGGASREESEEAIRSLVDSKRVSMAAAGYVVAQEVVERDRASRSLT
jgi:DNA primase